MDKKQITVLADEKQESYVIIDEKGERRKGLVIIKAVMCGKKCGKCPHGPYKYIVWKQDGKTRWKYIGKVEKGGD